LARSFNARAPFVAGGAVVALTGMAMLAVARARHIDALRGQRAVAGAL
jgi:hypothetical protein